MICDVNACCNIRMLDEVSLQTKWFIHLNYFLLHVNHNEIFLSFLFIGRQKGEVNLVVPKSEAHAGRVTSHE